MPARSPAALAALLILAAGFAHAGGGGPEVEVSYAGCEGWGAWAVVPLGQVRPHVPSDFTIRGEEAGLAQVGVVVVTCPTFAVEGVPAPGTNYFVLFAELASHVGSYDILEITDSAEWQGAMQVVDKASERTDDFTIAFDRLNGRPVLGHAELAHQGRTIRSSAQPALAAPMDAPSPSTHWGKGSHGIVQAEHDNVFDGFGGVLMHIEVDPGTLEAGILGTTRLALPGLFLGYGATARFSTHG